MTPYTDIAAIVFDLDGTLYVSPQLADAIRQAAAGYIAALRGVTHREAAQLMADTRAGLKARQRAATLSAACIELGGTVPDLHAFFEAQLQPEELLTRDQRVIDLLGRLAGRCDLYLYTNNNRPLTSRIIAHLGFDGLFRHIYAIDDSWRAKPDRETLGTILAGTGAGPKRVLFVGDRYEVDLELPKEFGCPVYLSTSVEELLRLEELCG